MSVRHNLTFEIGFWHPFGPHAGETVEQILQRKQQEITKNGWTLWSFQYRTRATLESWFREIQNHKPNRVVVFCSDGKGAISPSSKTHYCTHYTPIDTLESKRIPLPIHVPHPMGSAGKATAFIVKNILFPATFREVSILWLKQNVWQRRPLPTRPEYLIKPGAGSPIRKFQAILELQHPYIAEIS